MHDKRAVDAAIRDMSIAHIAEEGLRTWFQSEWLMDPRPLAADVWVFTPDFYRILVNQPVKNPLSGIAAIHSS